MDRNNEEPIAQALQTLDRLAIDFIRLAAPVEFRVATGEAECEAVYRLRYQTVIKRGWGRPEDFPGGMERDEYDEFAIQITGWDGGTLAAAGRMVFPSPERPLPTETAFGITIEPRGAVVDWSRTVVARQYSSLQHRLLLGYIGKSWAEMRRRGYSILCGDFTPSMLRLYQRVGVYYTPLGPPQDYWNEQRIPALLDIVRTAAGLSARFTQAARSR